MDGVNENNNLHELKQGLVKIKELETALADSKWNQSEPSPRATLDFQNSLLERYHEAKSLYMQRRLETIMVDQVSSFDPDTGEFNIPDAGGDMIEVKEKHANAITTLETSARGVRESLRNMQNTYQAICSRRVELERMVKDLEQDGDGDGDGDSDDCGGGSGDVENNKSENDAVLEQGKVDLLQQKKRKLQEDLASLRKLKEGRLSNIAKSREELVLLKEEESKILESGQDPTQFHNKIQELKEMKEFYDSLREVMEELGGVKILNAVEDNKSNHLLLHLVVYDNHQVEIELEVFRKTLLKLVNAKWITSPFVFSGKASCGSQIDNAIKNDEDNQEFSLPLYPLDDLVQVAKTSMGPPHDVRFVIREICARIRNIQNRVDDLAILRQRVLTKVVGNNQVVCSLNEGIVIDMRLYDQWVEVEQIIGVGGLEKETTDKIHEVVSKRDESWTPSVVVDLVQKEVKRLKEQDGLEIPKTPVIPSRKKEEGSKTST